MARTEPRWQPDIAPLRCLASCPAGDERPHRCGEYLAHDQQLPHVCLWCGHEWR